jgi:hypothetical protein
VSIFERNSGCRITGRKDASGLLIADGAVCELGADSALRSWGIERRSFRLFRLDPVGLTWVAVAESSGRNNVGPTSFCSSNEGPLVAK